MRLKHDEIKEILPDYLKGPLSPEIADYIETHLKECDDCRAELDCIKEVFAEEVPVPVDLTWQTLPQRVRLAAELKKPSGFISRWMQFRHVAIGAVFGVLVLVLFSHFFSDKAVEYDPFFRDPLSYGAWDYGALEENDIPAIKVDLSEELLYQQAGNFMNYGYQREFAYMDAAELERFQRVLDSQRESGG